MQESIHASLRYLVIGAGAVGAYIGGSLALGGHPVVFLTTPASAQRLQQRGLRLKLKTREGFFINPQVYNSPQEAFAKGPFDVGIFALKSYHTRAALDNLEPFREMLPPLLCLQNGVENEELLAAAIGQDKVIAGTVTSSISRTSASEIVLERLRGVGIAANHSLSARLCNSLNSAGLNSRLYPHADQMKWSKLLTNLLVNSTCAILDMSPVEILAHPGLYKIEAAQLREALAVMKAQKIHPLDLPGTPVRALALAVRWMPDSLSRRLLQRTVGHGRGAKMPSLHIDLYSGKEHSEVTFLNGAVVRSGENFGVPTPINQLLVNTLVGLIKGTIPNETYTRKPSKLLAHFLAATPQ